jgi:hypothetical protein
MPNDAYMQSALANDHNFRRRVRTSFSAMAWQVTTEDPATPNYDLRVKYARQVIRNLDGELSVIMPSFVMRPNVNNFATSYFFDFVTVSGYVKSETSDADIQSQLATDWDTMAAVWAGSGGAASFGMPPMP